MGRLLIILGIVLLITGLIMQIVPRFLGKLPGDIMYSKGNLTIYFPFMTMIIASIILTVILNILLRFFK